MHIDELKYANGDNITFVGPGHGSVVQLQSQDWYVYHSWAYKQIGTVHMVLQQLFCITNNSDAIFAFKGLNILEEC